MENAESKTVLPKQNTTGKKNTGDMATGSFGLLLQVHQVYAASVTVQGTGNMAVSKKVDHLLRGT